MKSETCYCSDCGRRLAPEDQAGCCLNPDHATGEIRRAEVIGPLSWQELDRAERWLITAMLTRFGGEASEAELQRELGCTDELLYGVAAERGWHAAQISGCLFEQDRLSITEQARDAFAARPRASVRRRSSVIRAAA